MISMPFHPSRRKLVTFAAGDDFSQRARVARHLEGCSECRRFVGFTQRLEKAAATLPEPALSEAILSRALAARAAGERVILPTSADRGRDVRVPHSMRIAAVALVAVAATLWWRGRDSSGDFASANELLLAGLIPRSAEAMPVVTNAGPLVHRLRPLALTYQRRFIDGASQRATEAGTFDVRLIRSTPKTWLLTSAWHDIGGQKDMSNARTWAESVTVVDSTLAPVARVVHVKPYSRWAGIYIDQRFRNDSVVGQMSLDENQTRRPIAHDLRAHRDRLIVSDALAPVYFMGATLAPGKEVTVSVLGWAVVPRDVLFPMRMQVTGSERIETPAGWFDCWKFTITVGGETHYHWVRKSDNLGVRTTRRMKDGRTRELVLIHEEVSG